MNYLNIVGKVVKKLDKENFNDNIAVDVIYMEIPQTGGETEILRVSIWDDAIIHISEIFSCLEGVFEPVLRLNDPVQIFAVALRSELMRKSYGDYLE